MLKISDITYSVAGRTLVEHASVTIPTGHKVGLVGRNGSGKTTLFKIIRGEMVLDTAREHAHRLENRRRVPRGARQRGLADQHRAACRHRARGASGRGRNRHRPDRIADVQTRLSDIDAWSAEARAASILKGLGFTHEEQLQALLRLLWRLADARGLGRGSVLRT